MLLLFVFPKYISYFHLLKFPLFLWAFMDQELYCPFVLEAEMGACGSFPAAPSFQSYSPTCRGLAATKSNQQSCSTLIFHLRIFFCGPFHQMHTSCDSPSFYQQLCPYVKGTGNLPIWSNKIEIPRVCSDGQYFFGFTFKHPLHDCCFLNITYANFYFWYTVYNIRKKYVTCIVLDKEFGT